MGVFASVIIALMFVDGVEFRFDRALVGCVELRSALTFAGGVEFCFASAFVDGVEFRFALSFVGCVKLRFDFSAAMFRLVER